MLYKQQTKHQGQVIRKKIGETEVKMCDVLDTRKTRTKFHPVCGKKNVMIDEDGDIACSIKNECVLYPRCRDEYTEKGEKYEQRKN